MWWKLATGGVLIALAGFLIILYGKARYNAGQLQERVAWSEATARTAKQTAKREAAMSARVVDAVERYAERVSSAEPVVVRSKETVTRYAATPAGTVLCLAADRVLGIEADRAALFAGYPAAAQGGFATVPPDPAAPR